VVAAVLLFAEVLMFDRVAPGSVVVFPLSVELVKLVGQIWGRAEEGFEEFF